MGGDGGGCSWWMYTVQHTWARGGKGGDTHRLTFPLVSSLENLDSAKLDAIDAVQAAAPSPIRGAKVTRSFLPAVSSCPSEVEGWTGGPIWFFTPLFAQKEGDAA